MTLPIKPQSHVDRNLANIHIVMRARAERLVAALRGDRWEDSDGRTCRFEFFEGFRHPERQRHLITTTSNTKAGPWESAHQYGLAMDFVCRVINSHGFGEWSWGASHPWGKVAAHARACGLSVPLKWDLGHVQAPEFDELFGLVRKWQRNAAT